ncbi:MAG: pentapeptide repeat-containing protein [Candidatus Thiodiazotropha sp. L084R]
MASNYQEQHTFIGDEKHLAVLLESIEQGTCKIWNNWRIGNQETPDLMGVQLSRADLRNYDFSATAFDDSDLANVNFTSCVLSGANFYRANMDGVIMLHAIAYGGNFRKAILNNANLAGTVFNGADLKGAILTGCKIHGIGRTGWEIEGVRCDYVYTDPLGNERFPKQNNFKLGQFVNIYKSYPLIDLEFHEKFDALTILMVNYASIQLNNDDGKFDFQVKEVSAYGDIPTIKVSVRTKDQIPEGTQLLKERIEDLQQQLKTRQVDVEKLYGLLDKEISSPPSIQNTFNREVSIGQFVNGNNMGLLNSSSSIVSINNYHKLIEEIDSSELTEEEKSLGKQLLDEMWSNASTAAKEQVGSWAHSLTKKGLEQLPRLLEFLS